MGAQCPPVIQAAHLTNTTNMKVILMLTVFAVCLPSIKAEDDKCEACCFKSTPAATSTVPPTSASSATVPPTSTKPPAYLADEKTTNTAAPSKCDGYITTDECNEKCGAATFTMSVAFVLVSVIMALHV